MIVSCVPRRTQSFTTRRPAHAVAVPVESPFQSHRQRLIHHVSIDEHVSVHTVDTGNLDADSGSRCIARPQPVAVGFAESITLTARRVESRRALPALEFLQADHTEGDA
jgi:hypothetical protein